MGCSPEGWICAVWRFPDYRRISVWFTDGDTVMYAARKSDGFFADVNNGSEVGNRAFITEQLVEYEVEWFTWFKDKLAVASSQILTT